MIRHYRRIAYYEYAIKICHCHLIRWYVIMIMTYHPSCHSLLTVNESPLMLPHYRTPYYHLSLASVNTYWPSYDGRTMTYHSLTIIWVSI